jgi:hypothetical protein
MDDEEEEQLKNKLARLFNLNSKILIKIFFLSFLLDFIVSKG